jgi:hypothetical protein
MRSVPSIARWLLQHLGSSPNNDAIMGDIAEQYAQSRSRIWYWRQVITAIATSMLSECWNHRLVAGQALIRGWLVLYLCAYTLGPLFNNLASWSRWWRVDWIRASGYTLSWLLSFFLIGYLVACVDRSIRVPLVLLFTVSSCGVAWSWFAVAIPDYLGHGFPRFYIFAILLNLSMPAAILAGGGLLRFKAAVKRQA